MRVAFHPLDEKFEVTNAIERNPAWIPDISVLWSSKTDLYGFITGFMERLTERRDLSDEERKRIPKNIQQLVNLSNYPMTALEISAHASEEQVAHIFVRINSKGRTLNQSDFILTLMSVYWDEGRKQLEEFCRNARQPAPDSRPWLSSPELKWLSRNLGAVLKREGRFETRFPHLRCYRDAETQG